MLRRNHATPFVADNKAQDYPSPVLIYLNYAKREYLATRGGLKGTQRDDEAYLARVINDLIDRDIERKNA